MEPRSRPARTACPPDVVRASAEDEANVLAAIEEIDRGEGVELTAEELRHWAETGEWPERLG
jgi:hypothetical protein